MRLPAAVLPFLFCCALPAQVIGPSVNMVTGVGWPDGDPFLQRQNEPSLAVSSRNALHLLAGANDYRTVDLPGSKDQSPTGDAWLGLFRSMDGGRTWRSTLVPGYPQDTSADGRPLKGMQAGADPVVRPGSNGLFYYGGLVFQRPVSTGASRIFIARYIDDNLPGSSDPVRFSKISVVADGAPGVFFDKPALAVDVPRDGAKSCTIPGRPGDGSNSAITDQTFPGGRVYVAWTEVDYAADGIPDTGKIRFAWSDDCGEKWNVLPRAVSGYEYLNQGAAIAINQVTGAIYIAWRVVYFKKDANGRKVRDLTRGTMMFTESIDGGRSFAPAIPVGPDFNPLDQDTASVAQIGAAQFRTTSYPSIVADGEGVLGDGQGAVYIAWSQRMNGPQSDARIVIAQAPLSNPKNEWECLFEGCTRWTPPGVLDPNSPPGHQFFPAMDLSSGKLTVAWYDLRETHTQFQYQKVANPAGGLPQYQEVANFLGTPALFNKPVADAPGVKRYTLDVWISQRAAGQNFAAPKRVSQYAFGVRNRQASTLERLQVSPPNLPIFQSGSVPFYGDYIDVSGSTFVPRGDGTWRFNTRPGDPGEVHVAWTDNRNVVPPFDGRWDLYTPIALAAQPGLTQDWPACQTGRAGMRNQDIYTARISGGLVVSSQTNAAPVYATAQQSFQRIFPITVHNTTDQKRSYQVSIPDQGRESNVTASFLQFNQTPKPEDKSIQFDVPGRSSASRTVFMTSSAAFAQLRVDVVEVNADGTPVEGGQRGSLTFNQDGTLPVGPDQSVLTNQFVDPDISTPEISNPEISNPEISNPEISNPEISNPEISNPEISNVGSSEFQTRFRQPDITSPNPYKLPAAAGTLANARPRPIDISNPEISNPEISNPEISNPEISNPEISNPEISNPEISNAAVTDTTWAFVNRGTTAASFLLKFIANQPVPPGVSLQVTAAKRTNTAVADGCERKVLPQYSVVASGPVATLTAPKSRQSAKRGRNDAVAIDVGNLADISNSSLYPSISAAPGERILITVRALDRTTADPNASLARFDARSALTFVPVAGMVNPGDSAPAMPPSIVTSSLGEATTGQDYVAQLETSGFSDGPPSWSISPNTPLPRGLVLNSATGVVSGKPLESGSTGVFFAAQSGDGKAVKLLNIVVHTVGLAITSPDPLPAGIAGSAYSQTLTTAGGSGALVWTLVSPSAALPPGLTLTPAGTLSGTPSASGYYRFIVRVTDSAGNTALQTLRIAIAAAKIVPAFPVIDDIRNGASFTAGPVAPGEIVTLFGVNLWDAAPTFPAITGGMLPSSAGKLQVTFNGIPAPLIFLCTPAPGLCAGKNADQINAVVPFEIAGQTDVSVVATVDGVSSKPLQLKVTNTAPAIFTAGSIGSGQGSIVNQDGSVNSASNPAQRGSVVAIYLTGAGVTKPPTATGHVTPLNGTGLNRIDAPVAVTIGGALAGVLYSGNAPGIVAGGVQINVQIPAGVPAGNQPLTVTIGGAATQPGVTVAVK